MTVAELDRLAKNTGCRKHDNCLTCPLPECIYDTKKVVHTGAKQRNSVIRSMLKRRYWSVEDLAEQLGVSTRTIQRALREGLHG